MHTFEATNGVQFHHNSDLSGDVYIFLAKSIVEDCKDGKYYRIPIDGQALLEFVADAIRKEKIDQLERASVAEILRGR